MKLIEKIAVKLGLFGLPVGKLSPYNLITDLCTSFVKAEELRRNNILIDGQYMSLQHFKQAAENYIGLDLVSEILNTEVRDGMNIHDHAVLLIQNTLIKANEYPAHYDRVVREITSDILKAQVKFGSNKKRDSEIMNEAEKKIVEHIETHGCHVTSVFDNSGDSPSFTYSTGIQKTFNSPEVIIVGLPNTLASSVVNNYMRRVREGEIFEKGEFYPDFLANFDVTFGAVSLESKREFLLSSCWYYKDEFEALQLVFPTTSGVWPWEAEASDYFKEIQPCLAQLAAW